MKFIKRDVETGIYHFELGDGSMLELCSNAAFDVCSQQHKAITDDYEDKLLDLEGELYKAREENEGLKSDMLIYNSENNEAVESKLRKGNYSMWRGRFLKDMSKEELIQAMNELGNMYSKKLNEITEG